MTRIDHPPRRSRASCVGALLLGLLVPGCTAGTQAEDTFVGTSLAEQDASFAPLRGHAVDGRPLADYLAERTPWLVAGIDFHAGQAPGDAPAKFGAAVALTADGYLLTATHNARQQPIYVLVPEPAAHRAGDRSPGSNRGRSLPVELGRRSFLAHRARVVWGGGTVGGATEITLLALDAPLAHHFERWTELDELRAGEPLVSTGWPLPESGFQELSLDDFVVRVAAGPLVMARAASPRGAVITIHEFVHNTPLRIGYSGGPLATRDGELVAVNVSVRETPLGLRGVGLAPHPRWLNSMIVRDRHGRR